jgi:hypothetical protein
MRAQCADTIIRGDDAGAHPAYLLPRRSFGSGSEEVKRIMRAVLRVLTFGKWPAECGGAAAARPGRKVWRISEGKPGGEWVDADSAPPVRDGDYRSTMPLDSWTTSSMDLLDGVQIVEHDGNDDDTRPH